MRRSEIDSEYEEKGSPNAKHSNEMKKIVRFFRNLELLLEENSTEREIWDYFQKEKNINTKHFLILIFGNMNIVRQLLKNFSRENIFSSGKYEDKELEQAKVRLREEFLLKIKQKSLENHFSKEQKKKVEQIILEIMSGNMQAITRQTLKSKRGRPKKKKLEEKGLNEENQKKMGEEAHEQKESFSYVCMNYENDDDQLFEDSFYSDEEM